MAHLQYSLLFTQQSAYYSYALTNCSNWSIFKQVYSFRIHFEAAHSKLKLLLWIIWIHSLCVNMQTSCYICYTQRERERERRRNVSVVWFNMLRVSTLTSPHPPRWIRWTSSNSDTPSRIAVEVKTNQKSTPSTHVHRLYIYIWIYVNIYEYICSCICLTADSISATRIWISLFVIRSLFANCATKCRWQLNLPKRIAWNVVISPRLPPSGSLPLLPPFPLYPLSPLTYQLIEIAA